MGRPREIDRFDPLARASRLVGVGGGIVLRLGAVRLKMSRLLECAFVGDFFVAPGLAGHCSRFVGNFVAAPGLTDHCFVLGALDARLFGRAGARTDRRCRALGCPFIESAAAGAYFCEECPFFVRLLLRPSSFRAVSFPVRAGTRPHCVRRRSLWACCV